MTLSPPIINLLYVGGDIIMVMYIFVSIWQSDWTDNLTFAQPVR